jgi:DNA repair exonuclease SbcCD nuclease subunit
MAMYVISGNHDRTSPHWSDVLNDGTDKKYGIVCADHKLITLQPAEETELRIYALPFLQKEDFLARLQDEVPKMVDILMWHGAIDAFCDFPMDTAIALEELPQDRFQVIATGDIHVNRQVYLPDNSTLVISPGSTEMCNSDEDPKKYQMELEFEYESGKFPTLKSCTPVQIRTRPVLRYKLVTEEHVQDAVREITQAMKESEGPLVLARVNQSLPDVCARLSVAVDRSKSILRIGALPSAKTEILQLKKESPKITALDILSKFIPPGTVQFELGQLLTDPEVNEKDAIERYCTNFLGYTTL